jgi:acetyl esterase/lipase
MNFMALVLVIFFSNFSMAQTWQPAPGYVQIPLWPNAVPDGQFSPGTEETMTKADNLVAGKPWHALTNVTNPTFTVYSPKVNNAGAAVVIFPGGGYKVLAIDLEGTEICDWLTSKGITCVLLKYRVPNSGCYWDDQCRCNKTPKVFTALQDAQRTVGLVRKNAAKWNIQPNKIGVLGFSAGGNLVAMISSHFAKRSYPRVDDADDVSSRPDFAIALYPGHMTLAHKNNSENGKRVLNPDISFTAETPPTFLLHSKDDKTNPVEYSLVYSDALKKLKVPVEMHLFAKGGHAFGLRRTDLPITKWPELVEAWLRKMKVIEN